MTDDTTQTIEQLRSIVQSLKSHIETTVATLDLIRSTVPLTPDTSTNISLTIERLENAINGLKQ